MSTRAAVAYKTPKGWCGVYQHFDGYPDGLGAKIWEILHKQYLGNNGTPGISNDGKVSTALQAFINVMIKGHPGGWSSFGDTCYCHDPTFVMRDGVRDSKISSWLSPDPLSIEYVYIIDPKTATMTVLSSCSTKRRPATTPAEKSSVTNYGKGTDWACQYYHRTIAIVDLSGTSPEPDWEHMEPEDE